MISNGSPGMLWNIVPQPQPSFRPRASLHFERNNPNDRNEWNSDDEDIDEFGRRKKKRRKADASTKSAIQNSASEEGTVAVSLPTQPASQPFTQTLVHSAMMPNQYVRPPIPTPHLRGPPGASSMWRPPDWTQSGKGQTPPWSQYGKGQAADWPGEWAQPGKGQPGSEQASDWGHPGKGHAPEWAQPGKGQASGGSQPPMPMTASWRQPVGIESASWRGVQARSPPMEAWSAEDGGEKGAAKGTGIRPWNGVPIIPCRYFSAGTCARGASCTFLHAGPGATAECKFFSQGRCMNGAACKFRHTGNAPEEPKASFVDFQTGLPKATSEQKKGRVIIPPGTSGKVVLPPGTSGLGEEKKGKVILPPGTSGDPNVAESVDISSGDVNIEEAFAEFSAMV